MVIENGAETRIAHAHSTRIEDVLANAIAAGKCWKRFLDLFTEEAA